MHVKESAYSAFAALYYPLLSTTYKALWNFLVSIAFIHSEISLLVVPAGLFGDNMVRWIGEQIYVKNSLAYK